MFYKRHRSSSSVAAVSVEGARSERKLDIRASIPEMDDQFATAESRCNQLQQKIDLFKNVKKKRKSKRRSLRMPELLDAVENLPVISVQTKPKKKSTQQCVGENSATGRGGIRIPYPPVYDELQDVPRGSLNSARRSDVRRARAGGDEFVVAPALHAISGDIALLSTNVPGSRGEMAEAACGDDEPSSLRRTTADEHIGRIHSKAAMDSEKQAKAHRISEWRSSTTQRPGYAKEKFEDKRRIPTKTREKASRNTTGTGISQPEERSIVQLFSNRALSPLMAAMKSRTPPVIADEVSSGPFEEADVPTHAKKKVVRRHHYEAQTVSSRMKRTTGRLAAERTYIPFVVSASTAPSHNLGVNLQQILNSLKTHQPPKGIPLTLAHHLGLGYVPAYGSKSIVSESSEANAIVAGGRVLRLSSRRHPSYGRALALLRAGEGLLPRYLRAVVRPRSMFDLRTRREDPTPCTGSKEQTEEVKRRLSEYAQLYRELERADEKLRERGRGKRDPALEIRRQQLAAELRAREGFVSEIVEEYGVAGDAPPPKLRASASHTEDSYRQSNYKLNAN